MQKVMADLQKKMASLGGIAVQQTVRMKPSAGAAAQMGQAQAGMAQAMAQLEAMRAAHAALPAPERAGRSIGIRRKPA